jgi:NADP-dependent 3-hydroxy acid dehydrogenase YdfG
MPKDYFQNKIAVVTGASSGIGRATAIALARQGASVALAARRKDALENVANEIKATGGKALVIPVDVTDQTQVANLITNTLAQWGHIDIFIANAGEYVRGKISTLTKADFEHSFAVNFYGALDGVMAVLPHMLEHKQGHIVLVSSLDAKKALPIDAPYAAAKSAITSYFEVLRQEIKKDNVHVMTIFPGRIDTPILDHIKVPWISPKIPPVKVAKAIVRGIRNRKTEVIVPGTLVSYKLLAALSPRFMDWIVRVFHLEGWEVNEINKNGN